MRYARKRKRFVYKLLLIGSLFLLGCLAQSFCQFLARLFPGHAVFTSETFHLICIVTILATMFRYVDKWVLSVAYKITTVRYGRDYVREIESLGQRNEVHANIKELGNLVVNTLGDALGAEAVTLLVKDRGSGAYTAVSSSGLSISQVGKLRFTEDDVIVRLARKDDRPMLRDELVMHFSWQEANVIVNEYQRLHSSLIIPLFYQGTMAGFCALSPKAKGVPYSKEDIKLFRDFSKRIGPVLGQALQIYELETINTALQDRQSTLLQSSKLTAIEQLASGFAHQIHNPLTIISGKAQVLLLRKEKHGLSDEIVKVLTSIVAETRRAADITQKLVSFSRMRKPVKEIIDFDQVLDDTLSLLSYRASLDSIKVVRHVQPNLPPFVATVSECREMFLNMFLNAIDAMEGGGVLMIKIKHVPAASDIEIKVSDSGKGIASSEIPHLFDPFFSTRHDRAGLGLFVAQKIVSHYGGVIRVDSQERRGTVLTIRFPVEVESVPHNKENSTHVIADKKHVHDTVEEEVHKYA